MDIPSTRTLAGQTVIEATPSTTRTNTNVGKDGVNIPSTLAGHTGFEAASSTTATKVGMFGSTDIRNRTNKYFTISSKKS